jgi:hypothetical protein
MHEQPLLDTAFVAWLNKLYFAGTASHRPVALWSELHDI